MGKFILIVFLIVVIVAVGVPALQSLGQAAAQIAQANAVSDMADAYQTQSLTGLAGMFLICASNFVSIIGAVALMAAGVMFYMRRVVRRSLPAAQPVQQVAARQDYLALPEPADQITEAQLFEIVERLWK